MKLKVQDLSASYKGEYILKHLNLEVAKGEFVTILGPSGCGKSTFLNILAGALAPDTGCTFVDDVAVTGLSSHFAYMPQDDLLMPWKTVMDNVCLYGDLHGDGRGSRQEAAKNLAAFGIDGYENKYPKELSGGMRQRAAFLRTALCAADIMLLDEPFASLDVITRGDMQDWLLEMRDALDRTTILVTHDIEEAILLSDRILILCGRPASFQKEITLPGHMRGRDWLYEQTELKREIHQFLKDFC